MHPQKEARRDGCTSQTGGSKVHASNKNVSKFGETISSFVVASHPLNKRESLRSELIERHGRTVIRIGRWKADRGGVLHPAGVGLECSVDHIDGLAAMLVATKQRLAQGGS